MPVLLLLLMMMMITTMVMMMPTSAAADHDHDHDAFVCGLIRAGPAGGDLCYPGQGDLPGSTPALFRLPSTWLLVRCSCGGLLTNAPLLLSLQNDQPPAQAVALVSFMKRWHGSKAEVAWQELIVGLFESGYGTDGEASLLMGGSLNRLTWSSPPPAACCSAALLLPPPSHCNSSRLRHRRMGFALQEEFQNGIRRSWKANHTMYTALIRSLCERDDDERNVDRAHHWLRHMNVCLLLPVALANSSWTKTPAFPRPSFHLCISNYKFGS